MWSLPARRALPLSAGRNTTQIDGKGQRLCAGPLFEGETYAKEVDCILCGISIMLLTVSASAAAPRFEDVSADTPFADSILYLADCGITNGTDNRLFSPDAPITTYQWAVILSRVYGLETSGAAWTELGQSAVRQVYQNRWMEATAVSALEMRMCRRPTPTLKYWKQTAGVDEHMKMPRTVASSASFLVFGTFQRAADHGRYHGKLLWRSLSA